MRCFLIHNNGIAAFVLRSLSKRFISGYRIVIVSVTLKKAKMAQFWVASSVTPTFFSFFLLCAYHKIHPWKVSANFNFYRTSTDELPQWKHLRRQIVTIFALRFLRRLQVLRFYSINLNECVKTQDRLHMGN